MAYGAKRLWVSVMCSGAALIAVVVIVTQLTSTPQTGKENQHQDHLSKDTPAKVAAPLAVNQATPTKEVVPSKPEGTEPKSPEGQQETELERARRLKLSEIIFTDLTKYKAKFLEEDKFLVPYEHLIGRFRSCVSDINPERVYKGQFEGTTFRYIFPGAWRDNYGDGFSAAWCSMFDALGLQLDDNQRGALTSLVWYVYDEGRNRCKEIQAAVIDPNEQFGDTSWDVAWEFQVEAYQDLYGVFLSELKKTLSDEQLKKLWQFLEVCQLRVAEN